MIYTSTIQPTKASDDMPSQRKQARSNSKFDRFAEPRRNAEFFQGAQFQGDTLVKQQVDKSPIVAKTEGQKRYLSALKSFPITIATGPAGTGKSYLATSFAAQQLGDNVIEKLIIARPAVEAGEKMGFLPGEIADKFGPYLVPYLETLHKRLGKSFTEYLIKTGRVEAVPFAYMRGRSWSNSLILLDEAQNTTADQMKLFLTRIGENSQIIINGDVKQADIKGLTGLDDAVRRISYIPSVKHVHMTVDDIVRSPLCKELVMAYED